MVQLIMESLNVTSVPRTKVTREIYRIGSEQSLFLALSPTSTALVIFHLATRGIALLDPSRIKIRVTRGNSRESFKINLSIRKKLLQSLSLFVKIYANLRDDIYFYRQK